MFLIVSTGVLASAKIGLVSRAEDCSDPFATSWRATQRSESNLWTNQLKGKQRLKIYFSRYPRGCFFLSAFVRKWFAFDYKKHLFLLASFFRSDKFPPNLHESDWLICRIADQRTRISDWPIMNFTRLHFLGGPRSIPLAETDPWIVLGCKRGGAFDRKKFDDQRNILKTCVKLFFIEMKKFQNWKTLCFWA